MLRQVELCRRQGGVKIGNGSPLPLEEAGLNLHAKDIAAPTMLHSLLRIPCTVLIIL